MYTKPNILTYSKKQINDLIIARASCAAGSAYCSKGATYCAIGSSYNSGCGSSVAYCSGGNYTGTVR